jgi:hypothetical protein
MLKDHFPLLFVDYSEMKKGYLCLHHFIPKGPTSNLKPTKNKIKGKQENKIIR